ncbi:MAG: hypothetical protein L3K13_06485, partial [Thermoplasmata archaeon]|nr:hypothetical protein [Thermoplasmata archaeon]
VLPSVASSEAIGVAVAHEQYYGGDTVSVTWTLGGSSGGSLSGWTTDSWLVYEASAGYSIYATGTIGSTAGSGSFTFPAPLNYAGELTVWVSAHNATQNIQNYALVAVTPPTILLSASEDNYLPGDTVHVTVSPQGSVLNSATLWGTATAPGGLVLWSGQVQGNGFPLTVPMVNPPRSILINVTAQSSTLGVLSSASLTIELASGWVLSVGIVTHSSYSDGAFQPGQTISIHYALDSLANQPVPGLIFLYVETYQYLPGQGSLYTQTTSTSGNLPFKIPSDWGNGNHYLYIYAELQNCFTGSCYAESDFTLPVETSPALLNYELVPNSGLTVGWLVLLLIIVVVTILLVILIRRRPPTSSAGPITPYKSGDEAGSKGSTSGDSKDASAGDAGSSSSAPPLPNPAPSDGGTP